LPSATATGASSAWTSAGTRACSSPLPHHPRAHWPLALTATQRGDVALFRDAFACAKRAGLGLTLHFAETAASASDRELETLLSFAPDRLGHVIHVSDAVKRRITAAPQPTLELCISCNVQIGLDPAVRQHRDHHFGEWWRAATNPIVLCVRFVPGAGPPPPSQDARLTGAHPQTDDAGVFATSCSNEYFLVATHFGLSRPQLWQLAFGAVDSVFADAATKMRLRERFLAWRRDCASLG